MTPSPIGDRPLAVLGAIALKMAVERFILPFLQENFGFVAEIVWQPTTVLLRYVSEGKRADAIIAIDNSIDALARDGIVDGGTRAELAHAVLGVAVKAGEPHPDISTLDAFRSTLMAARGVAYSTGGASGIYFQELVARLGLTGRLSPVTIPAGFTAEKLVTGEADIAIQQISELLSVSGVEIVGQFPEEVQSKTSFSVALFSDALNRPDALRFIEALVSDAAHDAYERVGLISRIRP